MNIRRFNQQGVDAFREYLRQAKLDAKAKLPVAAFPGDLCHRPMGANRQRHALAACFFADDHRFALGLRLEPDQSGPGDGPRRALRRFGDQSIGPKPDGLVAALKFRIEPRRKLLKPQARPGWIRVA